MEGDPYRDEDEVRDSLREYWHMRKIEEEEREMETRAKRIEAVCKRGEIEIIEGEILRLINLGYTDDEILDQRFIRLFQKNRNELHQEVWEVLNIMLNNTIVA